MYDCRLPDYALPFDAEAFQAGKKRLAMESLQVRRYRGTHLQLELHSITCSKKCGLFYNTLSLLWLGALACQGVCVPQLHRQTGPVPAL